MKIIVICIYLLFLLAHADSLEIVGENDFYPGMIGFVRVGLNKEMMSVFGNKVLAYGVPGNMQLIHKNFNGNLKCGEGFSKEIANSICYVNQQKNNFYFCSNENEVCRLKTGSILRWGDNEKAYLFSSKEGDISCNIATLGDPSPKSKKFCSIYQSVWTHCSSENNFCSFDSKRLVKFGTESKWIIKEATNGIDCDVKAFDGDPAYNKEKSCEFLPKKFKWVSCGDKDEKCSFFGVTVTRFRWKSDSIWLYNETAFEFECKKGLVCYYALYED